MGKWIKRPRCQGRTAQGPDEPIEAARCYIKLCAINSCLLLNVNITMQRGTALCYNMFLDEIFDVVLFSTMLHLYQISFVVYSATEARHCSWSELWCICMINNIWSSPCTTCNTKAGITPRSRCARWGLFLGYQPLDWTGLGELIRRAFRGSEALARRNQNKGFWGKNVKNMEGVFFGISNFYITSSDPCWSRCFFVCPEDLENSMWRCKDTSYFSLEYEVNHSSESSIQNTLAHNTINLFVCFWGKNVIRFNRGVNRAI